MLTKLFQKLCHKPRQTRKDIVIVFPYQDHKILLIKEYRKDCDMEMWKFISGGMVDNHELI